MVLLFEFYYYKIMQDLRKTVGNNIKLYRKKLNLTQENLAAMINIAPPSLSNIENGITFPSYSTLTDIIKSLNIKPYQLFLSENESFDLEDKELQKYFEQKLNSLDKDKKRMIFIITDALLNNEK